MASVFFTVGLLLFASTSVSAQSCSESELLNCGAARYCPSAYTCYDNDELCPILDGEATLPCGMPYGCYNPGVYDCNNGTLEQRPLESNPFTLVVKGGHFGGSVPNACDSTLLLRDEPCTFCPDIVVQDGGVCPDTNKTVFANAAALDVEVPGGQEYYVQQNGIFGYTQPHSGAFPQGAIFGVLAYEGGEFILPGSDGWVACVGTSAAFNPGPQIWARLPGSPTFGDLCFNVSLWTVDWPGSFGAWEYT